MLEELVDACSEVLEELELVGPTSEVLEELDVVDTSLMHGAVIRKSQVMMVCMV